MKITFCFPNQSKLITQKHHKNTCNEWNADIAFIWIGMESMEEMIAVHEAVQNIGTAWFWLGGKYNSTSEKYQWVGSGVDADVATMFQSYPPTGSSNYNLALRSSFNNIDAYKSTINFQTLCEEY